MARIADPVAATWADAYRQKVVERVDQAPPLGQTQKARLAMLLRDAVRENARPLPVPSRARRTRDRAETNSSNERRAA